jgi:hypothetical protein
LRFGGESLSTYCISGIFIKIIAPEWALHENLKVFKSDKVNIEVCCNVVFEKCPHVHEEKQKFILNTNGTYVYEFNGCINISNNDENDNLLNIEASENWSVCTIFINPDYNNPNDRGCVQKVREAIFGALRIIMIAALLHKQGFIVHSSTILLNGKGIMFAAPSGMGKSTHVHLWSKLYGTEILDGDVTACRMVSGVPYVYGLPWCGTSDEFMNHSVPLKAIIFLQQAEENRIVKLNYQEAFIRLAAGCFQLPLNDEMTNQFLNAVQEIAACTDCYLLNCLPDNESVELVKNCLEKN